MVTFKNCRLKEPSDIMDSLVIKRGEIHLAVSLLYLNHKRRNRNKGGTGDRKKKNVSMAIEDGYGQGQGQNSMGSDRAEKKKSWSPKLPEAEKKQSNFTTNPRPKLPDVRAYSKEIARLQKQRQLREAVELFKEMDSRGIKPDVVICSQLVTIYGKLRQPELALKMLETMETERGLVPNDRTYNAAISACAKGGQWQQALSLLQEMREKGVIPDRITYSAAISACGKGGQWQQALSLLQEMREKGVTPNVITYSAAISACEKGGEVSESASLLKRGMEEGLFVEAFSIEKGMDKLDLHPYTLYPIPMILHSTLPRP
jgi:pentatricopeptide repeat protein